MRRLVIELEPAERQELERRIKSSTLSVRDQLRARIVLLAGHGMAQGEIAEQVKASRNAVGKWCRRFAAKRLRGLDDAPGRGRKPSLLTAAVQTALEEVGRPPPHLGRWSCRTMAAHAKISKASVQRLWAANEIKPHLTRTFKISKDKAFEQRFWDVIALYLSPPDQALVLCCDEKSQVQALQRTQPGLPLGIGHIKTKTHDYVRHGTLTLFAALNYLEGKLITALAERHRHQEWLAFLKQIDRGTPKDVDLHLIVDNYGTHKHPTVKAWLARHRRFHMHFTPTSSSWMNMVERFFRDLTDFLREGSFTSTRQLADAIIAYLSERNRNPKRYVWRAEGQQILRKIERARAALAAAAY